MRETFQALVCTSDFSFAGVPCLLGDVDDPSDQQKDALLLGSCRFPMVSRLFQGG